ncbi:tRNA (adenosine(37)-N6)-threonylcarbamoyltransferase complex ATPase subunit type 1 TsaE [Candidatus Gracilibacteria bacterium]|nr:tRNA (adenosine(37)-N6)-threonylcarbamoyltransferase complex ATPase subunit type 1 TsaE [Candidatus Gracilibacteria bacterium]
MIKKYSITEINDLNLMIKIPNLIYLQGDLGAGKTTLSKAIINSIFGYKKEVTSPTYTYYNKYIGDAGIYKGKIIHHFDLYRLKNYDEFFAIGGEEILDNNEGIILVEWPEILEGYYNPDLVIKLNKTDNDDEREIEVLEN